MRDSYEKSQNASTQVLGFSAFVGFLFSFFGCLLFGWMATKTLMFEYAAMMAILGAVVVAVIVHWGANFISQHQHREYVELQTWARRFLHDPEHFTSSPAYQFAPFDPASESLDIEKRTLDSETQLMLAVSELYQRWQESRSHQAGKLGELLAQRKTLNIGDEEYVEKQLHQYLSHFTPKDSSALAGKLFLLDINHTQVEKHLADADIAFPAWFSETVLEIASYSHRFEQSALFSFGQSGVLIAIPKLTAGEHSVVAEKLLSLTLDRLPHVKACNFVHIGVQDLSKEKEAVQQLQLVKMALYAAKEKQICCWKHFESEALKGDVIASNERWNIRLQSIISRHDVVMVAHPVFISRSLNINHYELKANIRDAHGTLVSESVFLPMAYQLDMVIDIEKAICRRSIELLEYEQKDNDTYSVKLHAQSLLNDEFRSWLITQLSAKKKLAKRLMFEIKHAELQKYPQQLSSVFGELHKVGVKLVVNEMTLCQGDWQLLTALEVAQLKIAPRLIQGLDKNEARKTQVAELHQFAKTINAKVVACGVSATAEWKAVQQLNVYSAEGSYFSQGMSALVSLQIA